VQNYERRWYDADGEVVPAPDAPRNDMGSTIDPAALGGSVRYAFDRSGVPVLVTEHGMHTADDALRAAFIEPSLVGLLDAIDDGVPVLGYLHWSLMDNFEWIFGYDGRLGLMAVDRITFERTRKPSADVFEGIARAGAVEA
jgi:beta-glucosidase